jgi:hypothetical protein
VCAYRKRRMRGLVRLPVDMSKAELDQLEARGYVDAKSRGSLRRGRGGGARGAGLPGLHQRLTLSCVSCASVAERR